MGCQSPRGLLRMKTVKTSRATRTAPVLPSKLSTLARAAIFCFLEVFRRNSGYPWRLGDSPTSNNISFYLFLPHILPPSPIPPSLLPSSPLPSVWDLQPALLGSHTFTELYGPWCFETEASLQAPEIHQCLLPATKVTKMCPDAWHFYTGSGDWMQALMSVCKHFTGGVIFLATLYFRFSMYLLLLIEFWFSETMSSYVAWTGFELGILLP